MCESLSCVRLFATPWTVAGQALLSMGLFRARLLEYDSQSKLEGREEFH